MEQKHKYSYKLYLPWKADKHTELPISCFLDLERLNEVEYWCKNNTIEGWRRASSQSCIFYFVGKEDALRAKLIFGGILDDI